MVRYILLVILTALLVFSYHPYVTGASLDIESGTVLSKLILVVFLFLSCLCFDIQVILKVKVIRNYFYLLVLISVSLLFLYIFWKNDYLVQLRVLIIPFLSILIGYKITISESRLKLLLFIFTSFVLLVLLSQIFLNLGGFVIQSVYIEASKNALGVLGATSVVLSCSIFLTKEGNFKSKFFYFAVAVLTFICLLTVRARAATLMTMLMILYLIYRKFSTKSFLVAVILSIFSVFLIFLLLPPVAKDYVYNSFFISSNIYGEDLLSGRGERNIEGLKFIASNPLLGNLSRIAPQIGWIHNYPLLQLFNYGILGAWWILILYLYLLSVIITKTLKRDVFDIRNFGYVLLLIPFGISMAEPIFPYGPGTATVFSFILFGISLNMTNNRA